jgi:hypothetical protein
MDKNNDTENKPINTESQDMDQTPPGSTSTPSNTPVVENKESESTSSPMENTAPTEESKPVVPSAPETSEHTAPVMPTPESTQENAPADANPTPATSSDPVTATPQAADNHMQQKSSKKGLFIAVIIVIILILVGVAGYMAIMMRSTLNKTKTISPQAVVTPVVTSPTPSASVSANAPLDEQAQGVDVGSIDQDMQGLQNDLSQL